ncbi:MAG: hypothetical protein E7439_03335 [Ruminococcaceae bacterium]|nr:hypothetical protein [Oscillospiraceae bacterium]
MPVIASGSRDVLQIRCEFDPLWEGYGKSAVFYKTEDAVYHVPLVENVATVPYELLADDGEFYFGIMGVAENTRTTEVVRLRVKQGAICEPTTEQQEPAPDIYKQILAGYGSMEARLNQLVTMHGFGGVTDHDLSDEYIGGMIRTNGTSAWIAFDIREMSLVAGGHHYTDYCIPPELATMCSVSLSTYNTDVNVTIEEPNSNGWCRMLIENVGNQDLTTDMITAVRGVYPLASAFIAEVADARVDYKGDAHTNLGEHVRRLGHDFAESRQGIAPETLTREADQHLQSRAGFYRTQMHLTDRERYLDKVRVPVVLHPDTVQQGGDVPLIVALHTADAVLPLAQKILYNFPASQGSVTVELDVGAWFAHNEAIMIDVWCLNGYLSTPVPETGFDVDWIVDDIGEASFLDPETGDTVSSEDQNIRFVGELVFYDTLREEVARLQEDVQQMQGTGKVSAKIENGVLVIDAIGNSTAKIVDGVLVIT